MAATPEQINKMCNFIRKKINNNLENPIKNLKILYGGSVNTKNALQLFA
jgi:triosephosphate isomerase